MPGLVRTSSSDCWLGDTDLATFKVLAASIYADRQISARARCMDARSLSGV
jgi:hypothetical protein